MLIPPTETYHKCATASRGWSRLGAAQKAFASDASAVIVYWPRMRIAMISFCIAAMALTAMGQGDKGSIAGTVTDPFGRIAKNVTVQAKNAATGNVSKITTMANGTYKVADLPAGTYDIIVNVPGLRGFQKKGLAVAAGTTTAFDIKLQEGTQLSTLGEDTEAILADQKKHLPPTGPTPRTADGRPDLSGVWWSPIVTDPGKPEWTPFAVKTAQERQANNRKDSPQAHCLPSAVVRRGPLYEFVQSKDIIVEISDDDSPGFHQIYVGASHPKDPDPLWYGDSVARWEGDTLVVDRVNFEDAVWLDQDAHPHSDKLHVIERIRRPDLGHLVTEITVEDPAVLVKPWTFKRTSDLAAGHTIREFMCTENNRDLPHLVGK